MRFLFDTNILVHLIRQKPSIYPILERLEVFKETNQIFISIISVGEIKAFAKLNNWGFSKNQQLKHVLALLAVVPITDNEPNSLTDRYAQLDAYSQGKLENNALPKGMSARNMGKNDLWIAATAQLLDATLLTTDKDFEHLNDVFLNIVTIDI